MAIRPRLWVVLSKAKDLKIAALPSGARNDGQERSCLSFTTTLKPISFAWLLLVVAPSCYVPVMVNRFCFALPHVAFQRS